MILVKGDQVAFGTTESTDASRPDAFLPPRWGMIHDPDGEQLPRCEVYFGPYRRLPAPKRGREARLVLTRAAKDYFGPSYQATPIVVERPKQNWKHVAYVVKIFYVRGRRGGIHPGAYHHSFKGQPLLLESSGSFFRLSLRDGCIVDDRGYVFP